MKRLLRLLGFEHQNGKGKGSHESWVRTARGQFRKVTVDCPKAPFSPFLIQSMASQAGLKVSEFYEAHRGNPPTGWPEN